MTIAEAIRRNALLSSMAHKYANVYWANRIEMERLANGMDVWRVGATGAGDVKDALRMAVHEHR
jgi:hypothetical protein